MAKTITVPGSAITLYQHPDTYWYPYPYNGRIVQVGTLSGLEAAISSAQPNDIIEIVWPGVYVLNNTLVPAASNVTIKGASGVASDIVLRGRGMDNSSYGGCPHGIYSQYPGLTVEDLTIEQFYFHGVTFGAGATSPTLRNVRMLDMGQQFLKVSAFPDAINNGLVENSYFAYTNGRPTTDHEGAGYFYGGMIDVHNSSGWVVRKNQFIENTPTAAEIAALPGGATYYLYSPAVYFWNRSTNPIVEQNTFINCARSISLGLILRGGGENDCYGGIARNNMVYMAAGRFSAETIAGSDGAINLWDCPNGKAINNTVVTNGQVNDAFQGRWSSGLVVDNNLSDDSIRMRDSANYTGDNNTLNASSSWFVNPSTGNLRLNSTGGAAVPSSNRSADVLYDVDDTVRPTTTKRGAHHYV